MLGSGGSEGFAIRMRMGNALGLDYFHVNGSNLLAQRQQNVAKSSLLQPRPRGPGRCRRQKQCPAGMDTGQNDAVGQFRRQLVLQLSIQPGELFCVLAHRQSAQAVDNRYRLLTAAAPLPG